MKQTFSFRRFGQLARKHYTENRINYIAGLGGYLFFILLCLGGALREDKPSLDRFESVIIFVNFFVPIVLAKINFIPYISTNRQVEAFTLPATRGEKFIFAVVNTFVGWALAIVGLEVIASLVAPRCALLNEFVYAHSIVGHWFARLDEMLIVTPVFATAAIFACTATRKGNAFVPMVITLGAIVLLYSLPTILLDNVGGTSVATLDFPAFIITLNNHMDIGQTVLESTTEKLMQPRLWHYMFVPTVLLISAWFKFREYETK